MVTVIVSLVDCFIFFGLEFKCKITFLINQIFIEYFLFFLLYPKCQVKPYKIDIKRNPQCRNIEGEKNENQPNLQSSNVDTLSRLFTKLKKNYNLKYISASAVLRLVSPLSSTNSPLTLALFHFINSSFIARSLGLTKIFFLNVDLVNAPIPTL